MTLGSRIGAAGGVLCIYCMIPYGQMTVYEARTAFEQTTIQAAIATSNHFMPVFLKPYGVNDVYCSGVVLMQSVPDRSSLTT